MVGSLLISGDVQAAVCHLFDWFKKGKCHVVQHTEWSLLILLGCTCMYNLKCATKCLWSFDVQYAGQSLPIRMYMYTVHVYVQAAVCHLFEIEGHGI